MRSKRYAIFIDIDGTLYTSANGTPKVNIEAIKRVREKGHLVFINTGRSYGYIPEEIIKNVPVDGYVAALGCDVRYRGKQLYSATLSKEQLRKVAEYFLTENKFCSLEGEEKVYLINPPRNRRQRLVITSPDDFDKLYPNSRVNIFTALGRMDSCLKELLGDEFYFIEHPEYYEGALKGNSKSSGMERILKHLGMTMEDSIAIGDSLNDLDMLELAGFSIAMEDSPDEVIKVSDAVTKTADKGGVAAALYKYVLGM